MLIQTWQDGDTSDNRQAGEELAALAGTAGLGKG